MMSAKEIPMGKRERFYRHLEARNISRQGFNTYSLLYVFCLFWIIAAFILDRPSAILKGSVSILLSPSNLLTDYIQVGGVGAAFFNAGVLTLLTLVTLSLKKVSVSGPVVAAIFTISGFSLFGKNIFNTLPIMLGSFIYQKINKVPYSHIAIVTLFSTALGPLVSVVSFGIGLPPWRGILTGYLIGMVIGIIMPPLATSFLRLHRGFNIFNVGFTAGIVGMFAIGLMRMLGIEIDNISIVSAGNNGRLYPLMILLSVLLLAAGFILDRHAAKGLSEMASMSGQLVTDFPSLLGYGPTLINMGMCGLLSLIYVAAIGGELNGPVLGGVLTVIGFAAFGVHLFNSMPIILGVFLAGLLQHIDVRSTSAMLAALFGVTLAPIAGEYGPIAGVIAGFSHMAMVLNVGYLHGGVNLYNNGFSGGFVAATMVPIIEDFRRRKKRRKAERE